MPPKKVQTTIKLQLPAGKATPAPPVGTALGPHGVNIMDFCKQYNAKTAKEPDGNPIRNHPQCRSGSPLGLLPLLRWEKMAPWRALRLPSMPRASCN